MINIKTKAEQDLMRESGKKLAEVKQILWDIIKPGITTKEINDIAYKEIAKRNCTPSFLGYGGFPATACISVNDELIHGIPNDYVLKEGDVVSIDLGLIWKGWHSDSAFTKGVGKISEDDKKLIDVAKKAFEAGIKAIKPGAKLGDVEAAIGDYITSQGMYTPRNFAGHGIGKELHEDPTVNNFGIKGTGPELVDGMVIAIEPMILQNSSETITLDDNWTIISIDGSKTSHYEHTVLIKNGKPELLTGGI